MSNAHEFLFIIIITVITTSDRKCVTVSTACCLTLAEISTTMLTRLWLDTDTHTTTYVSSGANLGIDEGL